MKTIYSQERKVYLVHCKESSGYSNNRWATCLENTMYARMWVFMWEHTCHLRCHSSGANHLAFWVRVSLEFNQFTWLPIIPANFLWVPGTDLMSCFEKQLNVYQLSYHSIPLENFWTKVIIPIQKLKSVRTNISIMQQQSLDYAIIFNCYVNTKR